MNSPKDTYFHTRILSLCLFCLLFVSCASDIECNPADRAMLLRIKQAFSASESPCLASWIPSSNCCNWTGVTCHAKSRHVTELSLHHCGISGELPSDFFIWTMNLTLIQLIAIPGITGYFPEFRKNSVLQDLTLCNISLSGSIPSSIGNLAHLSHLDLRINNLKGEIPSSIGNLAHLSYLDLGFNNLKGKIPSSIGNLAHLSILVLHHNNLTGMVPSSIKHLAKLRYICLRYNRLEGPVPLPPLDVTSLDYSNNNFSSVIPANLSLYLKNTVFLSFANNRLKGEIPESIGQSASNLEVLDFSNNNLTGPIQTSIFESQTLFVLKLNNNNLEGVFPSRINEGCQLRGILVGENHLNGMLPKSLLNCSELEVIDITNNHISGAFPFWFGNFTELSVLILKGNGFYGPVEFIESVDSKNHFSKIQVLDLSSNNFTGNLPSRLLKNLKSMMNASTVVMGDVDCATCNLTTDSAFQYGSMLVVSSEGYSFTLGRILKISYTFVDFSNNDFDSHIPSIISQFHGLHTLNLSFNALAGEVPSSIGKMIQLEKLDLSENHLSGNIPQELASLNFLRYLNLSNNNLSGVIPQAGQLTTFTNNSFNGNTGLCGSPLSKLCGKNSSFTDNSLQSDADSSSTYVIGMALSVGLGFGFGIAIVFVCQNI